MICLIILQVFTAQIDSTISAYRSTDYQKAYNTAFSIPVDSLSEFYRDEVIELRAYTSVGVQKFNQADSLFHVVFDTKYPSIRAKAYFNYAELKYRQFEFDERLVYLLKAYEIQKKQQYIRVIAEHYFEIEGNYEESEKWIERHGVPETSQDVAGLFLLRGKILEQQRMYEEAMRQYVRARTEASITGMFDYELFAAKGESRMNHLIVKYNRMRTEYLTFGLLVVVLLIIVTRSLSNVRYI